MPPFFLMIRRPPRSPLFPYPTLFRSRHSGARRHCLARPARGDRRAGSLPLTTTDRKSTRLNSSHSQISYAAFFFNDPATTEISTLSLPDALPISSFWGPTALSRSPGSGRSTRRFPTADDDRSEEHTSELQSQPNLLCRLFF